jgi:hypothetical protein
MGPLTIQPAEGDLGAACACCAGEPGLRGFVYEAEEARAVYFVEPLGTSKFPMIKLGIAFGEWSSGSPASGRTVFALMCKPSPQGLDLSPAEPKMIAFPELAMFGRRLAAAELAAHPSLAEFRELAAAILDQDWRLEAIRAPGDPRGRRRFSAEAT